MRLSPRAVDVGLAATFVVVSVAEALTTDTGVHGPRGASAAAGAAMSLVVLWRRTRPVAAAVMLTLLIVPAAEFLIEPSEIVSPFLPLLVLGYSGGAYASQRDAGVVLGVLLAAWQHQPQLASGAGAGLRARVRPAPRADAPARAQSLTPILEAGGRRLPAARGGATLAADRGARVL